MPEPKGEKMAMVKCCHKNLKLSEVLADELTIS
jgi:hypothetical protein